MAGIALVLSTANVLYATGVLPRIISKISFPNKNERRILTMLPGAIASTCQRTTEGPNTRAVLAKLSCHAPELAHLQFNLFESKSSMYFYYNDERVEAIDAKGSNCQREHEAEYRYYIEGAPAGRVLCWQNEFARVSYIEWVIDNVNIYAYAWRDDMRWRKLYEWWWPMATIGRDHG